MRVRNVVLAMALPMSVTAISSASNQVGIGDGPNLGQKPPGTTAKLFAPALVPEDESAGCSGFLNDGTVFVYSSMTPATSSETSAIAIKVAFAISTIASSWSDSKDASSICSLKAAHFCGCSSP